MRLLIRNKVQGLLCRLGVDDIVRGPCASVLSGVGRSPNAGKLVVRRTACGICFFDRLCLKINCCARRCRQGSWGRGCAVAGFGLYVLRVEGELLVRQMSALEWNLMPLDIEVRKGEACDVVLVFDEGVQVWQSRDFRFHHCWLDLDVQREISARAR